MANILGDGLYKLEASDQIPIVHFVHLYVIVFRNKYCLNQTFWSCDLVDLNIFCSLTPRHLFTIGHVAFEQMFKVTIL